MFRNILVPLDGSLVSEKALPLALQIARKAGANVRLTCVVPPAGAKGPPAQPGLPRDEKAALNLVAWRVCQAHRGGTVSTSLVEGPVAPTLAEHAAGVGADLIVMTTHGRSGLARAVLGSISDQIVRRSRCPVLLARPHRHVAEEREAAGVSDVLVLLDGTVTSEAILAHALEVCRLTGASCTLLHVAVPEILLPSAAVPVALADQHATAEEQWADTYLTTRADRFREEVVAVTTATVRHTDVADGILEYCASHPVSLIAMGTRGTKGLERAMLGSTMDALLKRTHLPVLATATQT